MPHRRGPRRTRFNVHRGRSVSAVAAHVTAPQAPFDAVADRYDETFTRSRIGLAQRKQTWRELDRVFGPGFRVLDLNCGTGVDALHLAERGVEVWACDSSSRMLEMARSRVESSRLADRVRLHRLPTEDVHA